MDPDANLEEQLDLAETILEVAEEEGEIDIEDSIRLAELVVALNEWLVKEGALPEPWLARRRERAR